jgi:hypothetical protein
MAIIPVVSLPASRCSAGTAELGRFQRFSAPTSASAARGLQEGAVPSPSGVHSPGHFRAPGAVFVGRHNLNTRIPRGVHIRLWASAPAPQPAFSDQPGGLAAQLFQTGRRLMRQTVLPTQPCGTTAPTRSHRSARHHVLSASRSARCSSLRFGLPLTPESGGPSRSPAAQYALTAIRARRLQEFQNAQQNVDRCHPPGRDPGRCGPRQSRRRV